MHVVRHQAVRVHAAIKLWRVLSQGVQIGAVIRFLEEAVIAIMATLDNVDSDLGNDQARRSRHVRRNGEGYGAVDGREPLNGDCHHLNGRVG
jgi:hypothetical protein